MPPKNKGKKGKKGGDDDDAFWAAKEKELEAKMSTPVEDDNAGGGGAFDALDDEDDEFGGGGLMAAIAAAKNKKKDKKKKKQSAFADLDMDDEEGFDSKEPERANLDDEWPEDDVKPKKGKKGKKSKKAVESEDEAEPEEEPEAPKEAERANLDDEWPEEDVKPKKGKKGKKGKKQAAEEDDDDFLEKAAAEAAAARAAAEASKPKDEPAPAADEPEEEEEGGTRILSKKEKEKLKKEKEKAKKKAQAAKKKAAAADEADSGAGTPEPSTPAPEAADEEAADEPAASAADKKKKKKKGAAKAEPEPAKPKKVSAHILAMQKAMEEKKRIEEEARKAEEERQRQIEEEERAAAEEEARIQAAKDAKREKERLKKEKAKAEGRLLTPAQKRERAAAEARKQALLASGVKIAALEGGAPAAKRPFNKKKGGKGPQAKTPSQPSTPAPSTPAPSSPKVEATKPEEKKGEKKADDEDDDWDKSDDEVADVAAGVKDLKVDDKKDESEDDWDKSSEDEAPPPPKPAAKEAPKPAAKPAAKAAPAKPAGKAAANGKKPVQEESESESEADSDEDSDEDSDDDSDDDSDEDSDDSSEDEVEQAKERARVAIAARRKAAEAAQDKTDLRSPICCILGHVDTGKTKLLDKIRQTSVQEGEAGGITQQIGATFFPKEALIEKTQVVNRNNEVQVNIPGLLIIDTPGHESFTNLRSRGSSLCNIAILVIDITHGLEPQTIESLNLLKMRKTPFIVALNKIDKLDATEWKTLPDAGFRETLAAQSKRMQRMFADRVQYIKGILMEQGLNSELYDENPQPGRIVSIVPTSAVTGEGVPDLLALLVKLTQDRMTGSLMYLSEAEATILEVKVIEGLGTTIDIVLVNGVLRESDKIVLCGMNGPIVTNVRALLTPQPMRELRIKSAYVHHKEVKAALGVKIAAPGLEKAIAGARMFVAKNDDEVEYYKDLAMDDLTSLDKFVQKSGRGVFVQASTLGSLEALLVFLKDMNIPVFEFGLGPVYKSAVIRAGLMLDRAPEYAVMLCFDVPVTFEAEEQAKREGVKIFSAMIIYHLFDAFKKHMEEVKEARQKEAAPNAVWPCKLKILKPFASRDPIILGCDLVDGATVRVGTPIGVVRVDKEKGTREIIPLGKITGLEINHKTFQVVKRNQIGAGVAVKIERASHQAARTFGRHFDQADILCSLISRQSLDTLKTNFRQEVEMSDWALLKQMKAEQGVQ